jgi:hypothetical protein
LTVPACSAGVFSGAELPASAVSLVALVRVLPVSDEELFKRLKSMTMIKNLWEFGRLPCFRPFPEKL